MTKPRPATLTPAAAPATATLRAHDTARVSPRADTPPVRRRNDRSPSTNRIGTSLGTTRKTLWPITIEAPRRISSALAVRNRAVIPWSAPSLRPRLARLSGGPCGPGRLPARLLPRAHRLGPGVPGLVDAQLSTPRQGHLREAAPPPIQGRAAGDAPFLQRRDPPPAVIGHEVDPVPVLLRAPV